MIKPGNSRLVTDRQAEWQTDQPGPNSGQSTDSSFLEKWTDLESGESRCEHRSFIQSQKDLLWLYKTSVLLGWSMLLDVGHCHDPQQTYADIPCSLLCIFISRDTANPGIGLFPLSSIFPGVFFSWLRMTGPPRKSSCLSLASEQLHCL